MTGDLTLQERKARLHDARAVTGRAQSGSIPCWSDRDAAIFLLSEVDRLRALMPECDQCGAPYLDTACGPTHAALAEPMRHPGEAQKQRRRADTAEAELATVTRERDESRERARRAEKVRRV